jgi:hypothetical protein
MAFSVGSGSDDYSRGSGGGSGSGNSKVGNSSVYIDIESMRMHLSAFATRLMSRVSIETLRPLPMFLGVNPVGFCLSAGAFTPPVKKLDKTTPEKISSRIKLNFAFFLSNYALLAAMVGIVVALMHPSMLFFVAIVMGLWSLHSFMIRHELIVFGFNLGTVLSIQQRFYVLFTITTLVVIWKCLIPTLIFIAISGLIIITHSFLRDPKHIESSSSSLFGAQDSDEDYEDGEGNGSGGSGGSSGSEVLVDRPQRSGDVI